MISDCFFFNFLPFSAFFVCFCIVFCVFLVFCFCAGVAFAKWGSGLFSRA